MIKQFTFKKYCKECGKLFRPSGKNVKLCDKCYEKIVHRKRKNV